tara:strand:- start:310 stop:888 length:579 start_codon:yes stop_codon:yes gene_type:complete
MEKIENLIIHIKEDKDDIKELPGYEELNYEVQENTESHRCWNCHKCIDTQIVSLPCDYINNIFYTNGNFCSYGCGLRYLMDNHSGNELWTKISLLHIYCKFNTGSYSKIKPVPNKKCLKVFGGNLSYEEYHNNNISSLVDVFVPPILPINNVEYSHENKKNNKKINTEYRLYRKKPIKNKNNIYDTMQLIVE